jgi:hypothetical protein
MVLTVRSRSALRWTASLVEPLLSTAQRNQFDHDFREVARSDPIWFCAFGAGMLSGITGSLPMSEPWRTAKVDAEGVARWPDGRKFGLREDTNDVIRPILEIDDAGIDPTTLALEEGISSAAAALIAASFGGWRGAHEILVEAQVQFGPNKAFGLATSAIRWAQHRRRAYRPESFDAWLDLLSIGWAGWADDVDGGGGLSETAEREIDDGARKERALLAKVAEALEFFSVDPD